MHLRETQLREELQSQEAEISRQREELLKYQKDRAKPVRTTVFRI